MILVSMISISHDLVCKSIIAHCTSDSDTHGIPHFGMEHPYHFHSHIMEIHPEQS